MVSALEYVFNLIKSRLNLEFKQSGASNWLNGDRVQSGWCRDETDGLQHLNLP